MNEVNPGSGKGILMAALVGATVGAGIALLFAPRSGQETRGWLAHTTREIKDRTASAFEHVKAATRGAARELGRDGDSAPHTDAGVSTMRG